MHPLTDMNFLKNPNLPEKRVNCVAVSCTAKDAIEYFKANKTDTFIIYGNDNLPKPVKTHPDMNFFHAGGNRLFSSVHLFEGQKGINNIVTGESLGSLYPRDVLYNACIIGNKIILNEKTVSAKISEFAYESGLTIIPVNQGYTKCSVCPIDENSFITDDPGIFSAAQNYFDDVLLISKNSIRLDGYDYGFFGGCCGKIDKNKLAVNGRIESHTDKYRIIDFLEARKTAIVELSNKPLTDIGSIIPMTEID